MTPRQQIAQIDKQIDANRATMVRRLRFEFGLSAEQWQRAWDRCPDLHAREGELFRQRGFAQIKCDQQAEREWQARHRRERRIAKQQAAAKRCPTCGFHTLAA